MFANLQTIKKSIMFYVYNRYKMLSNQVLSYYRYGILKKISNSWTILSLKNKVHNLLT